MLSACGVLANTENHPEHKSRASRIRNNDLMNCARVELQLLPWCARQRKQLRLTCCSVFSARKVGG
eukprot:14181421-Alexandrium_andersonii.AAC.1